jgi:hypothetical protein
LPGSFVDDASVSRRSKNSKFSPIADKHGISAAGIDLVGFPPHTKTWGRRCPPRCLNRRMSDKRFLKSEVAAWEANRNKKHTKANWQFTTQDARVELRSLYPSFWLTRATRFKGS